MFKFTLRLFQKNLSPEEKHQKWLHEKVCTSDIFMSKNEINWEKIRPLVQNSRVVTFLYKKGSHAFRGHNLENIFKGKEIRYIDDENWEKADFFVCMAFGIETPDHLRDRLLKINKPILIAEETFLRSVTPSSGAPEGCPQKFLDAVSHFLDARSPHFYTGAKSSLEQLLNADIAFTSEQKEYSARLIDRIVNSRLSKYNSQRLDVVNFPDNGRDNVLIVDQVKGDMAITLNGGSDADFEEMLQCAVKDNPDCNIVIKTHVDARKGVLTGLKLPKNAILYTEPVNMLSLLQKVKKMYVYSSGAGIEGILAGKEVNVFGSPVYAGWGLTHDRRSFPDRTRKLTREELFYKIYILYSWYCNPLTNEPCDIETALDVLTQLRDEYIRIYRS